MSQELGVMIVAELDARVSVFVVVGRRLNLLTLLSHRSPPS